MTPLEAVKLCRLVKACCPQQQIDEFTPDAWHGLLDDQRIEDCILAVKNLGRRQPFISPSEIRSEVQRIRSDRLERVVFPDPPADLPDDPLSYKRWLMGTRDAILDGTYVDQPRPELKPRDMSAIENTFSRPPRGEVA